MQVSTSWFGNINPVYLQAPETEVTPCVAALKANPQASQHRPALQRPCSTAKLLVDVEVFKVVTSTSANVERFLQVTRCDHFTVVLVGRFQNPKYGNKD